MNWTDIIKYKKANELLCDWMKEKGDWNLRDLYDFFDENGIIVNTYYSFFTEPNWGYVIKYGSPTTSPISIDAILNSRTEAEESAFLKAFEILENKLK